MKLIEITKGKHRGIHLFNNYVYFTIFDARKNKLFNKSWYIFIQFTKRFKFEFSIK